MGEKIVLTTEEEAELVAEAVPDPAKEVVIGKLLRGESAEVLGCYDMKHYIVPKVRLANGKTGYLMKARFRLQRRPAWSTFEGSTVFSCRAIA